MKKYIITLVIALGLVSIGYVLGALDYKQYIQQPQGCNSL